MKKKTLDFLKAHQSEEESTFVKEAEWRQENAKWLEWSQNVALGIIDFMQANGLSRSDVAEKLGCSPQYVSKILSGQTNFSFKSIAEMESRLGIPLMNLAHSMSAVNHYQHENLCDIVAEPITRPTRL